MPEKRLEGKREGETGDLHSSMQGRGKLAPSHISAIMHSQLAWPKSSETPDWWVCECEAEISDTEREPSPTVINGLQCCWSKEPRESSISKTFLHSVQLLEIKNSLYWLSPTLWKVTKQSPWEHEKSGGFGRGFFNVLKHVDLKYLFGIKVGQ